MGAIISSDYNRKDFTLIVAGRRFDVEKSVLALHSSVFSRILDLRPQAKELVVDNMDVRTVEELIKYMYGKDTSGLNEPDIIIKVLIAAKCYKIKELESITLDKLENIVTNENAICVMKLAARQRDTDILMFIIRAMVGKNLPVIKSHELQEFYEMNSAIAPLLIRSLFDNQRIASSPIDIPRRKRVHI